MLDQIFSFLSRVSSYLVPETSDPRTHHNPLSQTRVAAISALFRC